MKAVHFLPFAFQNEPTNTINGALVVYIMLFFRLHPILLTEEYFGMKLNYRVPELQKTSKFGSDGSTVEEGEYADRRIYVMGP